MSYKVEYSKNAHKQIKKMDQYTKVMLMRWITKNLVDCDDPREHGKPREWSKRSRTYYSF